MNNTRHDIKAKIKATGQPVTVYRRRSGGYVNSFDLKTRYTKEELILL